MTTSDPETGAGPALPDRKGFAVGSGSAGGADVQLSNEDIRFVHHLHFEHLRNLTTLSVSATGGGLVALQAGLLDLGPATAIPLICFALAAVISLLTQRTLFRDLAVDGVPSRRFALLSEVSSWLFGGGVGSAAMILVFDRIL